MQAVRRLIQGWVPPRRVILRAPRTCMFRATRQSRGLKRAPSTCIYTYMYRQIDIEMDIDLDTAIDVNMCIL